MVRKSYLLLALFLLVVPRISQGATIYEGSLTDPYSGTYTLTITDAGDANPNTYHATLTVETNTVTDAYIDWFVVHFDTPAADITSAITASTGTWLEGTGSTDLVGYGGGFPNGGAFSGGYEVGILNDGSVDETGGFPLDGLTYSWSFDFAAIAPILGENGDSNPNLQVGFYGDGVPGNPRLSQGFTVSEPSTLLLLGSGLLWLGMLRRKIRG